MQDYPVIIIGAGLTGLSCAYHLWSGGYLLLEKEMEPGGIVRTRIRMNSGFYCDGTGHWLHLLQSQGMKDLVNELHCRTNSVEHERKAVIFSHGVFTASSLPRPTLTACPAEVIMDCLLGTAQSQAPRGFTGQKPPTEPPANFRDWIVRAFGEGIARHFMVPYNQKLLGVNLTELMPAFAERFIPRPSTEDVIKGALGFSKESLGYNAKFVYPREGGIGGVVARFR